MKTIGIYMWPNMTSLDVLGPHQLFGYAPDFDVVTVAKGEDPVVTDTKIRILPDHDAFGELVAAVRAQTDELSPGLTEFLAAKNS